MTIVIMLIVLVCCFTSQMIRINQLAANAYCLFDFCQNYLGCEKLKGKNLLKFCFVFRLLHFLC